MNMDITAAAIATLISSGVATCVAIWITSRNELKSLNDQLDGIIKIAIQYPYLENKAFADSWDTNRDSQDEKYLRYDNYCNLIFNYLERLCTYYKFDKEKIEKHLNVRDWIRVHKQCWLNPSTPFENTDSYSTAFKTFIEAYLK
jgi:hypothetical protein